MAYSDDDGDWIKARLRPGETAVASMAALLWMALIGSWISCERIASLMSSAFRVDIPRITIFVGRLGAFTTGKWYLSIPFWGLAFVLSMTWSLRTPGKRLSRLCAMICALAAGLLVALLATYIPMAQAAQSIANPTTFTR